MFNLMKTAMLMAAITALFMAVGQAMGGQQGMVLALLVALGMNFFSYWFSDKMVLKMYNAREVDENTAPGFYRMVRELAQKAELPMPRVYIIDEEAPNAFATGRNPHHAAVAATTGIMRVLNERELRGVMAHELAHVKHRDILIGSVAAAVATAWMSLVGEPKKAPNNRFSGPPFCPTASDSFTCTAGTSKGCIQPVSLGECTVLVVSPGRT